MPTENSPFKAIVLAFSGGGYRAAAFHLGLLKMLDRLGLRQHVRGLSTISGGTIVGAAYIKSLVDGTPFNEFVEGFRAFLRNTNVVEKALQRLRETRTVNGIEVDASLIRSAANVYDRDYFGGMRFGEVVAKRKELPEISFNTTEFRSGIAFRFQTSPSDDVGSGNNRLDIPQDSKTNHAARVGDIVAASSCFPAGFEPIRFPSDFVWKDGFTLADVKAELGSKFKKEVPLMDGGVYDNQGIDSAKKMFRRIGGAGLDLLVVSDVDPRSSDLLDSPVAKKSGFFTVQQVYLLLIAIMLLAFATTVAIIVNLISNWSTLVESLPELILLNFVPLTFALLVFISIMIGKSTASDALKKIEETMELSVWETVRQLRVAEVIELVFSRIKSLVVMSSSVFMRRIRSLEQGEVKKSDSTRPLSIFALIYGLRTEVPSQDLFDNKNWQRFLDYSELQPSDELLEVAKKATDYGTNLWFLESDSTNLDNLIRCGEVTFCYFLIVHLLNQKSDQLDIPGSEERKLFDNAKAIWDAENDPKKAATAGGTTP